MNVKMAGIRLSYKLRNFNVKNVTFNEDLEVTGNDFQTNRWG